MSNSANGWVKIHRKLLEWEWCADPNVVALFIHLLLTVNHEQGRWQGMVIEPGQKVTTVRNLAQKTGLTIQQTRTALFKLNSTNEITIKTTPGYSLIEIKKWVEYQSDNRPNNKQTTNNQHASQQTNNTYIRNKEERSKEDKKNTYRGEGSLDWVRELPLGIAEELAGYYRVDTGFVISRANDLIDYCEAKGKRYSNYKAALRNFIKSEIARHPEAVKKNPIPTEADVLITHERTPEEQARINAKLEALRQQKELLAKKLT